MESVRTLITCSPKVRRNDPLDHALDSGRLPSALRLTILTDGCIRRAGTFAMPACCN